jgi:hypothetical protein
VAKHYPGERAEEAEASVAQGILSSQGLISDNQLRFQGHRTWTRVLPKLVLHRNAN